MFFVITTSMVLIKNVKNCQKCQNMKSSYHIFYLMDSKQPASLA